MLIVPDLTKQMSAPYPSSGTDQKKEMTSSTSHCGKYQTRTGCHLQYLKLFNVPVSRLNVSMPISSSWHLLTLLINIGKKAHIMTNGDWIQIEARRRMLTDLCHYLMQQHLNISLSESL